MKSKIGILVLCLFCQFCFGQILTRKTVHGQVVNDSIKLENGIIFNVNSKTGTIIKEEGYFSILAKVNDTLVFSSLAFKPKKITLTEKEISTPLLRVKLEVYTNQLAEVIVSKKAINPIDGNSQKYVDMTFFDDEKSSPKNTVMPSDGTIEYGMDFVRMYREVFKLLRKNNPDKRDFVGDMNFTKVAMKSVSYTFFTHTLNLKDEEIGLFLIFCENDPKSKMFLKSDAEFQLIDFLITKNEAFKKITTFKE